MLVSTSGWSYTIIAGPGNNLIANQLDNPVNNSINTILTAVPDNSLLFKWNPVSQSYLPAYFYIDLPFPDGGWYDGSFMLTAETLNPGEAAFLQLPGGPAVPLAFTGTPRTVPPPTPVSLVPGWNFLSCQAPQPANYFEIVGAPPLPGTCVFQYDYSTQPSPPPNPTCGSLDPGGWIMHAFLGGTWYRVNSLNNVSPGSPVVQVGEGVVVYVIPPDNSPPTVTCTVQFPKMDQSAPNFLNVGLNITATANCTANPNPLVKVKVFSNEADSLGMSPDGASTFTGGTTGGLKLRRERLGAGGKGRVFLIVVTATDSFSNTSLCCQTVVIPHSNSAAALASVNQLAALALANCSATGSPQTPHVIVP